MPPAARAFLVRCFCNGRARFLRRTRLEARFSQACHRLRGGQSFDVSADLTELARTPLAVVCAGAKSILDLAATLEVLETLGVPVVGIGTNDFPAFYLRSSGHPVAARVETGQEAAALVTTHWQLGGAGVR